MINNVCRNGLDGDHGQFFYAQDGEEEVAVQDQMADPARYSYRRAFIVALLVMAVSICSARSSEGASVINPALTTEHELTLTPLSPDTLYFYTIVGAAPVTRGPYLQIATPTSIAVKWRTGVPTASQVDFGFLPLPGNRSFRTPPLTGSTKPTRIWVIGDSGMANWGAIHVRDAYLSYTGTRATDVWITLGDNAYASGTDLEYQNNFFNIYPTLLSQTAVWPTYGNHDAFSSNSITGTGPYFNAFKLPTLGEAGGTPSGTEAYYSFNRGNIHFISLNSQELSRSLPGTPMLAWLASDLQYAAPIFRWIIAFWHHPPYTKGSHNSDTEMHLYQMRQYVLPILENYGVDLVLGGHSHSYERSFLLDSHYGPSTSLTEAMVLDRGNGRISGTGAYKKVAVPKPHRGTVYAVVGSSSMISPGPLNHPAMFTSLASYGSMVIDVSPSQLDANLINEAGTAIDNFTILKVDAVLPNESDLDGNFLGDLLWRNPASGQNKVWLNPGKTLVALPITAAGSTWRVAAQGDFDGDGKTDIV